MSKRLPMPLAISLLFLATTLSQAAADSVDNLAADFWAWRAQTAPFTSDDVARIQRPDGTTHDWSAPGVAKQAKQLALFDARWKTLENSKAQQVDHRLMGSALARVHWELDILKRWQRDPNFYIEQTLTPVAEALTPPGPYDEKQSREILLRLNSIPATIQQAEQTLVSPPAPFAKLAIESLAGVRPKLQKVGDTLPPQTTIAAAEWKASADRAATALEQFRSWLETSLPPLPAQTTIGR